MRHRIFSIARTLFGYACLTANNIVTITLRHHLESALDCLHVYDTLSRFNLNGSKRGILDYSLTVVIFMITYWCIIGYIITQNESEKNPYWLAFAYAHFYSINDDAVITYFCVTKLYFDGAYGLIRIHLPLLISVS
ncbi:hypothetical protein HCN44_010256 [Aphidius gifuensis]|uniref:Uncharacterized protein n=1 Tax=Aphidius gifuensis TaxID=684658 RepID=A0A834XZD9_APHGI|nr:hypothetical protein HCN44_010256 [Aphidius gifuensis]